MLCARVGAPLTLEDVDDSELQAPEGVAADTAAKKVGFSSGPGVTIADDGSWEDDLDYILGPE